MCINSVKEISQKYQKRIYQVLEMSSSIAHDVRCNNGNILFLSSSSFNKIKLQYVYVRH